MFGYRGVDKKKGARVGFLFHHFGTMRYRPLYSPLPFWNCRPCSLARKSTSNKNTGQPGISNWTFDTTNRGKYCCGHRIENPGDTGLSFMTRNAKRPASVSKERFFELLFTIRSRFPDPTGGRLIGSLTGFAFVLVSFSLIPRIAYLSSIGSEDDFYPIPHS